MAATEQDEDLNNKIVKQIEYYFGDINLPKDKFLQDEMKKDQGWISFKILLKCNRIKKLTNDKNVVKAAVAAVSKDNKIFEISEDLKKIRRNPDFPIPEHNHEYLKDLHHRTVYINQFPLDATLDDIISFLQSYGTVENLLMRKHRLYKTFKGSVFVTFSDKETAEQFVANSNDHKYNGKELVQMMQYDYWTKKANEKKEKKEKKALKQLEKVEYLKGQVLHVCGLPSENIDFTVLKEFFMQYGTVAYADYNEESSVAWVRFESDEENAAVKAMEKINDAAKDNDGKILILDKEIQCKILEGDEEEKYWTEYYAAYDEMSNRKRGKKRPYYKRGNYFKNKRPRTDETYRLKRKEENRRLRDLRLRKKKLRKYWSDTKNTEEM